MELELDVDKVIDPKHDKIRYIGKAKLDTQQLPMFGDEPVYYTCLANFAGMLALVQIKVRS